MQLFTVTDMSVELLRSQRFAETHKEESLQRWADMCPALLNDGRPMLSLGMEIPTQHGHSIDNLFLDQDGVLVVGEIKRGKASRDVVAQAMDYASHIRGLDWAAIETLCLRKRGFSLDEGFRQTFGFELRRTGTPAHRMIVLAEEFEPAALDTTRYLHDLGGKLLLLQFTYLPGAEHRVLSVIPALGTFPAPTIPYDDMRDWLMNKTWTLDEIKKLPPERRAALYENATRQGSPEGKALAQLIEDSGLSYQNPNHHSDQIMRRIDEVVFSDEGRAAVIRATEQGLPALAGVDPLLQAALGNDYGSKNLSTASAGDRVANLMRELGYKESGKGALPNSCTARSGIKWER